MSSCESARTRTRRAGNSRAASSAATRARYSATLFVATPMCSLTVASRVGGSADLVEHDGADRSQLAARAAVAVDDEFGRTSRHQDAATQLSQARRSRTGSFGCAPLPPTGWRGGILARVAVQPCCRRLARARGIAHNLRGDRDRRWRRSRRGGAAGRSSSSISASSSANAVRGAPLRTRARRRCARSPSTTWVRNATPRRSATRARGPRDRARTPKLFHVRLERLEPARELTLARVHMRR